MKTLDDFCAVFHGQNSNGTVWVKPYDADEVYRTMSTVAAYDWKTLFDDRLRSKSAAIPARGFTNGGYKLVYTDAPNMFTDPWTLDGSTNAYGSLGIHVSADGTVDDAWPTWPAYFAGISQSMKLIAVNGRKFSSDELRRAVASSNTATLPVELIVENGSYYKTVKVDYHGGVKYPHLERVAGTTDMLTTIAGARTK